MARQPRAQGLYYHVIVRGIGKQILFETDNDRRRFFSLLRRFRDETCIVLLAYCLMENHVHLLIFDLSHKLPVFMKKLGISYAQYYNEKYDRIGHLFQDRYKSQVIEDDASLLNVYRYILKNPEKAGLAIAREYKWNSYCEYGRTDGLTDSSMLVKMIGNRTALDDFLNIDTDYEGMEDLPIRHNDKWALEIIKSTIFADSGTVLQQMAKAERDEKLATLKKMGISVRQLERLTGISKSIIQRA